MYKNQEETYANDCAMVQDSQPELSLVIERIGHEISEIIEAKNVLSRKLHQIKDTNVPENRAETPVQTPNDALSTLNNHLEALAYLKESFYKLNQKLNSLI